MCQIIFIWRPCDVVNNLSAVVLYEPQIYVLYITAANHVLCLHHNINPSIIWSLNPFSVHHSQCSPIHRSPFFFLRSSSSCLLSLFSVPYSQFSSVLCSPFLFLSSLFSFLLPLSPFSFHLSLFGFLQEILSPVSALSLLLHWTQFSVLSSQFSLLNSPFQFSFPSSYRQTHALTVCNFRRAHRVES